MCKFVAVLVSYSSIGNRFFLSKIIKSCRRVLMVMVQRHRPFILVCCHTRTVGSAVAAHLFRRLEYFPTVKTSYFEYFETKLCPQLENILHLDKWRWVVLWLLRCEDARKGPLMLQRGSLQQAPTNSHSQTRSSQAAPEHCGVSVAYRLPQRATPSHQRNWPSSNQHSTPNSFL